MGSCREVADAFHVNVRKIATAVSRAIHVATCSRLRGCNRAVVGERRGGETRELVWVSNRSLVVGVEAAREKFRDGRLSRAGECRPRVVLLKCRQKINR